MKMKIVIPMAGIGKRLLPLTQEKPKPLIRLARQRLLDYVLGTFRDLENTYELEYIFIVGYLGEQIKDYMQNAHPDKKITYYVQEQLNGQSPAVYLAKDSISGPILMTYCDTIIEADLSFLPSESMDSVIWVQDVDDPRRFGVAITDPNGLVAKLVEKPKTMEHKSALAGLYYFSEGKELLRAIEIQMEREKSLNNEYYLADAIGILVEQGMRIRTEKVLNWLDAGTHEAVFETNTYLLQAGSESKDSNRNQTNKIIHPVYIHESANVEDCAIGPNVSIGANCTVSQSTIKNSIIDDDSNITKVTLENSLIGKACLVKGDGSRLQAIVADYDEIKI